MNLIRFAKNLIIAGLLVSAGISERSGQETPHSHLETA